MNRNRKYQAWGEFLKERRSQRFRSARDFYLKINLGISYPQYSRYEQGEQLPQLDHALTLCEILGIPLQEGFLKWCESQAGGSSLFARVKKELFSSKEEGSSVAEGVSKELSSKTPTQNSKFSLDEVLVLNRAHVDLFNSTARSRDVFTFIASLYPSWVEFEEISQRLRIPTSEVRKIVKSLCDQGLLLGEGKRVRAAKSKFYFPNDEDFFDLRNRNVLENVDTIMRNLTHQDVREKRACRRVVTRKLTPVQIQDVFQQIENFIEEVVDLPDADYSDTVYSLCMILGERFNHNENVLQDREETPGLTRKPEADSGRSSGGLTLT